MFSIRPCILQANYDMRTQATRKKISKCSELIFWSKRELNNLSWGWEKGRGCVYVGVGGIMEPRPWVIVVLRHFSLFLPSIDSPLFSLQDKMVTCQLWRHLRSFVRINAIVDPPFSFVWKSPSLIQNYRKLILK